MFFGISEVEINRNRQSIFQKTIPSYVVHEGSSPQYNILSFEQNKRKTNKTTGEILHREREMVHVIFHYFVIYNSSGLKNFKINKYMRLVGLVRIEIMSFY